MHLHVQLRELAPFGGEDFVCFSGFSDIFVVGNFQARTLRNVKIHENGKWSTINLFRAFSNNIAQSKLELRLLEKQTCTFIYQRPALDEFSRSRATDVLRVQTPRGQFPNIAHLNARRVGFGGRRIVVAFRRRGGA